MICNKCGNKIEEGQQFCNNCGEKVQETQVAETTQTVAETTPQAQPPKKSNTGLIVGIIVAIVLVLLIIVVIAIVILFAVFGNKKITTQPTTAEITTTTTTEYNSFDDDKKEAEIKSLDLTNVTIKAEDDTERSKNVELVMATMNQNGSKYFTYKPEVYLAIIQKNNEMIDVDFYINYYKDGKRIGSDRSWGAYNVKPNVLMAVHIPLNFKEEYDSFTITYETDPADSYMKDVEITSKNFKSEEKDDDIVGTLTNNTDKKLTAYGSCLYYKDNKLVYITDGTIIQAEPGKVSTAKCYKNLKVDENFKYDRAEMTLYSLYYTEGE